MIEGVIVLPVAVILMAGSVEFGQVFSEYGTAEKSVRDAARYLARVPNQDTSAICGWGLTNAQNLAVYGKTNPAVSDQPLIQNWSTSQVTLHSPTCGAALTDPVIIDLRADVPYSGFLFGIIGISNAWTLTLKHQERSIGQ